MALISPVLTAACRGRDRAAEMNSVSRPVILLVGLSGASHVKRDDMRSTRPRLFSWRGDLMPAPIMAGIIANWTPAFHAKTAATDHRALISGQLP